MKVLALNSGSNSLKFEVIESAPATKVALAVDVFSHRVRKYLGAYLAVLGGADAIVLGGGISENTPLIRERIFRDFEWFDLALDLERNKAVVNREGSITKDNSRLPVWVIPTRENLMVAYETVRSDLN